MVPWTDVGFELNGEARELTEFAKRPASEGVRLTVRALLEELDLVGRRVAVAINAEVVPRSRFATTPAREGDRVEVIQAVGGG